MNPVQNQYHYPVGNADAQRARMDDMPRKIGEKLEINFNGYRTPIQQERDQLIYAVSAAVFLALGAVFLTQFILAAGLTVAAGAGVGRIVFLKPDLDDPQVRLSLLRDFFKNRPSLAEFCEKFTLDEIFDYQLLPTQIDYERFAVINNHYHENKKNYNSHLLGVETFSKAKADSKKAEMKKAQDDLKSAERNIDDVIRFLANNIHKPGYQQLFVNNSRDKHIILNEIRKDVEVVVREGEIALREYENNRHSTVELINSAYNGALSALEEQFKAMIPAPAVMPVARPVNQPIDEPILEQIEGVSSLPSAPPLPQVSVL